MKQKLSELLMNRKDLTKKVASIKEELLATMVTNKGPAILLETIETKFISYSSLMDELKDLNIKIDKLNARVNLETLAKIKILDSKLEFYSSCRKKVLENLGVEKHRFTDTSGQINYEVETINKKIEFTQEQRRELDKQIQSTNWSTLED